MVKIHKILTGLALWGIISAGAVLCPVWAGAKTEKYTNTDFAMNTVVSETLYTTGKNLNPSVGELLKNTEENLLSWTEEDSQIAALNAAQGKTLEVSDELAGYLEKIQQLKFFFFIKRILISIITGKTILSTEPAPFLYNSVGFLTKRQHFAAYTKDLLTLINKKKEYSNDMYHSNIPLVYPRYVIKSLTKYA